MGKGHNDYDTYAKGKMIITITTMLILMQILSQFSTNDTSWLMAH